MPTTSVNIGFRPPRIATLVRRGSVSDIAAAAAANTHVWGGIYNPIVAVDDDVEAATDELRLFRPDLVTVIGEPSPTQSAVLGRMRHLVGPVLTRDPFEQFEGGAMQYADVRLICRHAYDTTFRFGVTDSRAILVEWPEADEIDPYLTVVLGRYRTGQPGGVFRRAFIEGLAASRLGLDELPTAVGGATPIGLTATALTAARGSRAAGVVVGPSTSPSTLLKYWNLRSVGCRVVLWPSDCNGPIAEHARGLLQRAQQGWSRGPNAGPVSVWMDEDDDQHGTRPDLPQELQDLLSESPTPWAHGLPYTALWTWLPATPCVWAAQDRGVLASVETRSNGVTELVAALPAHPFVPAIAGGGADYPPQKWLVTVSAYRTHDLEPHTFEIPPIPTLTPWASGALTLMSGNVRLERKGVALFKNVDATSVTLRLVDERAVIQRVFAEAGLIATTSPAGEAAGRIIRQMGGLWRCRELRLDGVRALLKRGLHAWTWQEAMQRLHDGGTYSRYQNVPDAPDLLRSLIERRALQAVFSLVCPSCAVRSDRRLDDLGEEMTCPRCGQPFEPAALLEQGTWKYRPSGFFANLSTHGALPVVLAMIRMQETFTMDDVMVHASLDVAADGWKEECDFVALWRDRAGNPVMAIGEAKGGSSIEQSDVTSLRRIAQAFRGLGVECYLVFATTRHEFTGAETTLFRQLRDDFAHESSLDGDHQGRRQGPVLLAAGQLDFHDFAPFSLMESLPAPHVLGMADLARDSLAIHLDAETAKRFRDSRESEGLLI